MERSNRTSRFDSFCIAFTKRKYGKKEENSKFYEMFSGRNIYANIKENKER